MTSWGFYFWGLHLIYRSNWEELTSGQYWVFLPPIIVFTRFFPCFIKIVPSRQFCLTIKLEVISPSLVLSQPSSAPVFCHLSHYDPQQNYLMGPALPQDCEHFKDREQVCFSLCLSQCLVQCFVQISLKWIAKMDKFKIRLLRNL